MKRYFLFVALLVFGCRHPESLPVAEPPREPSSQASTAPLSLPSSLVGSPSPTPPVKTTPLVMVTDAKALALLEKEHFSFGAFVLGEKSENNKEAAQSPLYTSMTTLLERDLAELQKADPQAGVGMKFAHRFFDPKWLRSSKMRFQLIAVVNRLDRMPFSSGKCGELRLVYRLAYTAISHGMEVNSRLPMTLNVVSWQPADATGGCQEAAKRWMLQGDSPKGEDLARKLLSTTLADPKQLRENLKSVEVNMQLVRWPATVRPDMAGHAEYLLRVFHEKDGKLYSVPLENTPDLKLLKPKQEKTKQLLAWLTKPENLKALDLGTIVLPEEFLSKRSISVSPRGFARLSNRPFRQLFSPEDFSALDLSSYRSIRSPVGLLRRLDELTCAGCHQSRSVAGFHLLGEDLKKVDALVVPFSPHVKDELARREAYVTKVANKEAPDEFRPLAERVAGVGGYGEHCGLGDVGFSDWTCAEGFVCEPSEDGEVGACFSSKGASVGEPCALGVIRTSNNGHKDGVKDTQEEACVTDDGQEGIAWCERNGVGFPGGMCAMRCEDMGEDAVCGGIPDFTDFNSCLAQKLPFETCILEHVHPRGMRECDQQNPCRDDYICAKTPSGEGSCMPPYFLFQLRVDGHPKENRD